MKNGNIFMSGSRQISILIVCSGIAGAVDAPVFSPAASQTPTQFNVIVTCATPGSEIHYTTNGNIPTLGDPVVASGSYVVIPRSVTLKAVAWQGGVASSTTTANYKIVGQLTAGDSHGLGLKSNKVLYSWGAGTYGRLGDGTGQTRHSPGFVKKSASLNFLDAIEVDAGSTHTLALAESGGVMAFGLNNLGQLGNNSVTTPADYLPVWVLKSATANDYLVNCFSVSAGLDFSAALVGTNTNNGIVYTWGADLNGRLGRVVTGTNNRFAMPVQTALSPYPPLGGITQISAGAGFAMARTPHTNELAGGSGNVWVWGLNTYGQLGLGSTTNQTRATQANSLTGSTDISAGSYHIAVVKWSPYTPGRVYCAGQQQYGRLGNNQTAAATVANPTTVQKSGGILEYIVAVAAGPRHTLALDSSGKVWAWGYNGDGGLGDNTLTSRGLAARVKDPTGTGELSNIVNIAAGGPESEGFSLASAADGTIYGWGANRFGNLGIGNNITPQKLPVVFSNPKLTNQGQPSVDLTATMPQTYEPVNVTFNTTITDADGLNDIARVDFFQGSTLLGSDTTAPYSYVWTNVPAGAHAVSAVATDISGTQGTDELVVDIRSVIRVQNLTSSLPEGVTSAAVFRLSRLTSSPVEQLVTYQISGTAVNGRDYNTLPDSVIIPANQTFVDMAVTSKYDYLVEPEETIILTIPNTASQFPNPAGTTATANITDIHRSDGDGLDAAQEAALGTSTVLDDTDGDGANDDVDAFPLDSDRWLPASSTPGDTSAPAVIITTPASAVMVSGP